MLCPLTALIELQHCLRVKAPAHTNDLQLRNALFRLTWSYATLGTIGYSTYAQALQILLVEFHPKLTHDIDYLFILNKAQFAQENSLLGPH